MQAEDTSSLGVSASRQAQTINLGNAQNSVKVAFGSCFGLYMDTFTEDNILERVKEDKPDLWVWLGDAAYMDDNTMEGLPQNQFILFLRLNYHMTLPVLKPLLKPLGFFKKEPAPIAKKARYYKNKFDQVREFPSYAALERTTKVVGVWDDHDMGYDNAGSEFAGKDLTRDIFLNFIGEPADSERRLQKLSPIHQDYFIEKQVDGRSVTIHLILLDNRYAYDKKTMDYLGPDQWHWLGQAFARGKERQVDYTVVGAGIQMLVKRLTPNPMEHFNWQNKQKLYDLMRTHQMSNVILLSGDAHIAQVYESNCSSHIGQNKLYEYTSSGMSHTLRQSTAFADQVTESSSLPRYAVSQVITDQLNYGLLEFDFSEKSESLGLTVHLKGIDGKDLYTQQLTAQEVSFNPENLQNGAMCAAIHSKQHLFQFLMNYATLIVDRKSWHCILLMFVMVQLNLALIASFVIWVVSFAIGLLAGCGRDSAGKKHRKSD